MDTAYHIRIAKEYRTSEVRLGDLSVPERTKAIPVGDQLHCVGVFPSGINLDNPNILTVIAWDQQSPWVTVLKGSIADLNAYGWPMVTEEEYHATAT
jgi:hypothetical protein